MESEKRRMSLSVRLKEQLLGKTFQTVYHIFCRIACLATFVVQFAILDVYLITYHNILWCLWIIPDLVVFSTFLAATIISYRHLKNRVEIVKKQWMGELPISYLTWLLYGAILSAKFCIIFALPDPASNSTSIANSLHEANFFGPNMLTTALSLASIVLYFFVLTNHDTKSHTPQNDFIQTIVGAAYIDLLDTVSFTGILLKETAVLKQHSLDRISMAIITFNFILPTSALLIVSRSYFGTFPLSRRNLLLYKVVHYVVVNLPMFLVRMVIWHLHEQNVSVFLVKNVLGLFLAVKDVHDFTVEVTKVIIDVPDGGGPHDPEARELDEIRPELDTQGKGNVSETILLKEAKT